MKKVSLHFGIKHFDPEYYGPDNDLRGCENDILYLAEVAKEKGYDTNVFLSKEATYSKYVEFMTKMGEELVDGDIFLFTVSCHGTYEDYEENGVEKRRTALCLHDRIVWDYETREMLSKFKEGVNVIWMADCCHARDNFKSLGAESFGVPKFVEFKSLPHPDNAEKALHGSDAFEEAEDLKCNIVAYSSSTEQQVSYDMQSFVDKRPMGLFTASIEKIFQKEENKQLNYFQIFKRIGEQIAKTGYPQTPKLQVVNGHKDKITYREFLN
jgi:hypothetical protein